ncbi:hypothetical protein NQ315_012817 [Exocentrus adspersus]|uniref:CCHC-type domain-containing protein n=1 Tax=Exocentrus adspersus TaxID=1586481 RepID=A0AAV8V957_9CUCU|nr:hypothetical protein NQ315_012817 [Exocentrus adspersus]
MDTKEKVDIVNQQPETTGVEVSQAAFVFTPKTMLARTPPRKNSSGKAGSDCEKEIEADYSIKTKSYERKSKRYKQKESQCKQAEQLSIGVQADFNNIHEELEIRKRHTKERIRVILDEPKEYDKITQVIDEKWPEETFKVTKVKQDKAESTTEEDLAIFVDPDPTKNGEELDKLKGQIPSIGLLVEEGLTEGKMEFIKLQIEVRSSRNRDQNQYTNTTFVLPMKMDKGIEDTQVIFDLVTQLKEEALKLDRKRLKVTTAGPTRMDYLRKIMEYIFREYDIQITIVGKAMKRKDMGQKKIGQAIQREKIIVKAKPGESYADLLKSVKTCVNIEEKGIDIKTIKKTNKGDLFLEVIGGKGKAMLLKQTIEEKNQNAEVMIKTDEVILHITDIDASYNPEELRNEIIKSENLQEHQARIISMRPSQNGNQTATVAMKRAAGLRVINRGKIKIGWINCRVRKRVNLLRCFRCHLFGHRKDDCKEKDRSNLCLKCLKSGHTAKDCNNIPACVVCNMEGHRADQTKCPAYRKLIRQRTKLKSQTDGRIQPRGSILDPFAQMRALANHSAVFFLFMTNDNDRTMTCEHSHACDGSRIEPQDTISNEQRFRI